MARRSADDFPVRKSNLKWQMELDETQYRVLRRGATERPFTSELVDEKRRGRYHCAGCGAELFEAETKFDSGTGWPSFHSPASDAAVGTRRDFKMILPRTEVHCAACGGHLGHVFGDGPRPSYQRYCINGAALRFEPADEEGDT